MQHHAHVQLPAGGEPFEQAQQMLLIVKVQRRGGFIKKQPALRRAVVPQLRQTAGELYPLLLTAGEAGIAAAGKFIAAGDGHYRRQHRRVRGRTPRRAPHGDDRFHRPVSLQGRALQHDRPPARQRLG